MRRIRRKVAVVLLAAVAALGTSIALAGQPGPGDKQCVPGQQGSPHPAHKAGVC